MLRQIGIHWNSFHSGVPQKISFFQPICNSESLRPVDREFGRRHFPLHLFKDHIHSIVLLCRMLILKMMGNGLQLRPHLQPPLFRDTPQCAHQEPRLNSLFGREEQPKLVIVKVVLKRQLNSVTYCDRDTVTDNDVKEPAARRCISSQIQAEAWVSHTFSRLRRRQST